MFSSTYDILVKSNKLDPKNEKLKKIILDAILTNKYLKKDFKKSVLVLLEEVKQNKDLIEDAVELRDEL